LGCHFGIVICRSFNDKPVNDSAVGPIGKDLFEREQDDLLCDLKDIPKKACDRRVSWNAESFVRILPSCTGFLKRAAPFLPGQ
jgi:EH domain-containing protein 1